MNLIFYVVAFTTVISAIGVVSLRKLFHSGLCLIITLLNVGIFYAMLDSKFLFVFQILVYVGGIAVLFLFVILLSGRVREQISVKQFNAQLIPALLVAVVILYLLISIFIKSDLKPSFYVLEKIPQKPLYETLFKDMIVPFEVVSILLLVALIGSVYFSKSSEKIEW